MSEYRGLLLLRVCPPTTDRRAMAWRSTPLRASSPVPLTSHTAHSSCRKVTDRSIEAVVNRCPNIEELLLW